MYSSVIYCLDIYYSEEWAHQELKFSLPARKALFVSATKAISTECKNPLLIFLPQIKIFFSIFVPSFANLFLKFVFSSFVSSWLQQMLSLDLGKWSQRRPPQPGADRCVDFFFPNAQIYGNIPVGGHVFSNWECFYRRL